MTSWRPTVLAVAATVVLAACMPGVEERPAEEATFDDGPVVLSSEEATEAQAAAGCDGFEVEGGTLTARHVEVDGPTAQELYDRRPPTDGDHLGRWIEAQVYEETPDERAVVHNHEHGAVSVWYAPDAIGDGQLATLHSWAEARNEALANDAGAGVIVAPFAEGLPGEVTVAFRSWTGGMDCTAFDPAAADGFLLERFGQAPEGVLAPSLDGVVDRATSA